MAQATAESHATAIREKRDKAPSTVGGDCYPFALACSTAFCKKCFQLSPKSAITTAAPFPHPSFFPIALCLHGPLGKLCIIIQQIYDRHSNCAIFENTWLRLNRGKNSKIYRNTSSPHPLQAPFSDAKATVAAYTKTMH